MSRQSRYECFERAHLWSGDTFALEVAFDNHQQVASRVVGSVGITDVLPLASLGHSAVDGHVIVIGDVRPGGFQPAIGERILALRESLQANQLRLYRSIGR